MDVTKPYKPLSFGSRIAALRVHAGSTTRGRQPCGCSSATSSGPPVPWRRRASGRLTMCPIGVYMCHRGYGKTGAQAHIRGPPRQLLSSGGNFFQLQTQGGRNITPALSGGWHKCSATPLGNYLSSPPVYRPRNARPVDVSLPGVPGLGGAYWMPTRARLSALRRQGDKQAAPSL